MKKHTIIPGFKGDPLVIIDQITDTSLMVTIKNDAIDYADDLRSECIDSFGVAPSYIINCLSGTDMENCISGLIGLCSLDTYHLIGMDLYDVECILSKNEVGIYRRAEASPENLKTVIERLVQSIKTDNPKLSGMIIYYTYYYDGSHMFKTILDSIDTPMLNDLNSELVVQVEPIRGKKEFITINVWGL